MKLIELKCPACGAEMKVNPELDRVICIDCGKEMLVDNGKTELIIANGYDYGYATFWNANITTEMTDGRTSPGMEFLMLRLVIVT